MSDMYTEEELQNQLRLQQIENSQKQAGMAHDELEKRVNALENAPKETEKTVKTYIIYIIIMLVYSILLSGASSAVAKLVS